MVGVVALVEGRKRVVKATKILTENKGSEEVVVFGVHWKARQQKT